MSHTSSLPNATPAATSIATAVPIVHGVVAMTTLNEKQHEQQNACSSSGSTGNSSGGNVMTMKGKIPMIDMTAHNGLRGVCALWVVLAHCLGNYVKMNASSIMPLFFMLSGFSLTAMYGRTEWALPGSSSSSSPSSSVFSSFCCLFSSRSSASPPSPSSSSPTNNDNVAAAASSAMEEGTPPAPPPSLPFFATRRFYQNRFARVLPIYWLCILLPLPLTLLGLEKFPFSLQTFLPSLVTSILPSATLLSFLGMDTRFCVLNGPGWFVCTLLWFWLAFPLFLPHAQRLSSPQLRTRILYCFYLQLILMLGVYALINETRGHGPPAFNTAAKNPLVRFPLFLMGMYAALLALRHPLPPSLPPSLPLEAATPLMGMSPVKTPRRGRDVEDGVLLPSIAPPPSLEEAAAGGGGGGGMERETAAAVIAIESEKGENEEEKEEGAEGAMEDIELTHQHQQQEQDTCASSASSASSPPRAVSITLIHTTTTKKLMTDDEDKYNNALTSPQQAEPEDLMPWPASFLGFPLPPSLLLHLPSLPPSLSFFSLGLHTPSWWSRKATRESIVLCVLTLLIGAGESVVSALTPTHTGFQATLWWQALVPFAQLNILMALTREGGKEGWAKWALMTPFAQWLGKISMTLYLSHMSVIRYAALAVHPSVVSKLWQCFLEGEAGREGGPDAAVCVEARAEGQVLPMWVTVVVVPVSLVLAEGLYRWVEVPSRQALRAK